MVQDLVCSVCRRSRPESELLLTPEGGWICRACQAQSQSQQATSLMHRSSFWSTPGGNVLGVVLALLLVFLFLGGWVAYSFGEGMRRAL